MNKTRLSTFIQKNLFKLLLSVLGVVLFFITINGLISTLVGLPSLYEELKSSRIKKDQVISKINLLRSKTNQVIQRDIKEVDYALPDEKDVGGILAALEYVRGVSGVRVRSLTLDPGVVSTDSAQMQVNSVSIASDLDGQEFAVDIVGEFEQVIYFIDLLTSSRRLIGVYTVNIVFFDDNTVSANIGAVAYYSPKKEIKFAIDEPLEDFSRTEITYLENIIKYPYISKIIIDSNETSIGDYRIDYFSTNVSPTPESVVIPQKEATGSSEAI